MSTRPVRAAAAAAAAKGYCENPGDPDPDDPDDPDEIINLDDAEAESDAPAGDKQTTRMRTGAKRSSDGNGNAAPPKKRKRPPTKPQSSAATISVRLANGQACPYPAQPSLGQLLSAGTLRVAVPADDGAAQTSGPGQV
eukprot:SAG31_NODE_3268_length_4478_cov_2.701987_3_plen_139_part_00